MGYSTATINVGHCHHSGIRVEKDEHKAFIYYQKSVDMGDATAMCSVGYCYSHGIDTGDATAMCSLGYCYRHGIGVEKDEQTDSTNR
ncbi:calmodulin-dependent protein kinase [Gigaspora margarita]|uniref:Calmodulin-dependent protein kinase n=1 Tax=Gigaspora margarita TaxID=4874 RepID=A0A8H4A616_GIGMA|nr:calmodulin-dependent protein kinase [Gigaspora margarita]